MREVSTASSAPGARPARVRRPVSTDRPVAPGSEAEGVARRRLVSSRPQGTTERRPGRFAALPRRAQRLIVAGGFGLSIGIGAVVGMLDHGPAVPAETAVVTVQPGDTLWQIADASTEPGADLRPVIDRIQRLNGLQDSTVRHGQQLVIPSP